MHSQEHIAVKLAQLLTHLAAEFRGFFIMGPPPQESLEGWTASETTACQHAVLCGDGTSIWTMRQPAGLVHRLQSEGHAVIDARIGSWHCVILRFGPDDEEVRLISDELRSRFRPPED